MKAPGGPVVVTIDVAHPPMSIEAAESALDDLLRKARLADGPRVIRIIHGYGSGGRGGVLKNVVRNWAYNRRGKIGAVIPGEDYSPFMPDVIEFLTEGAGAGLADFSDANEGMTFLLLR